MESGAIHGLPFLSKEGLGVTLSAFAEKIQYIHRPVNGAPPIGLAIPFVSNKGTLLRGLDSREVLS